MTDWWDRAISHNGEAQCRSCQAPTPVRHLIEGMRALGISQRDVADYVTKYREYALSATAIMRHDAHFKKEDVMRRVFGEATIDIPVVENGEISITKIARHKLQKYWETQADVVPSERDAREWGKLLLDAAKTGNEAERTDMLRQLFSGRASTPALPPPSIEGEFEALN